LTAHARAWGWQKHQIRHVDTRPNFLRTRLVGEPSEDLPFPKLTLDHLDDALILAPPLGPFQYVWDICNDAMDEIVGVSENDRVRMVITAFRMCRCRNVRHSRIDRCLVRDASQKYCFVSASKTGEPYGQCAQCARFNEVIAGPARKVACRPPAGLRDLALNRQIAGRSRRDIDGSHACAAGRIARYFE
jgi:hypothetical protein